MTDEIKTPTLEQWRSAVEACIAAECSEKDTRAGRAGKEYTRHVTDPGARWAPSRKHQYGALPVLLDAVPEGARTATSHHTIPASQVAGALPAQATHAVIAARQQRATGIVVVAPREVEGTVTLTLTLVLTPLPVTS